MNGTLGGQLAVVTGQRDISTAAKVVKTFGTELDRLKVQFGYLNNQRLEQAEIMMLADLPSLEVLRAKLLGLFSAPASTLVRLLEHAGQPDGARAAGPRRQAGRSASRGAGGELSLNRFHPRPKPMGMGINKQQRKSSVCWQRT